MVDAIAGDRVTAESLVPLMLDTRERGRQLLNMQRHEDSTGPRKVEEVCRRNGCHCFAGVPPEPSPLFGSTTPRRYIQLLRRCMLKKK